MQIDATDRRLLRLLQDDASQSVSDLAVRAGMSTAPCWRRLEKLEAAGVIQGRRVEIDYTALGFSVLVFLRITLDKTNPNAMDEFVREARKIPEVETIQTLLGRVDVRMDVRARDLEHYQDIYRAHILRLPHMLDLEALMLVSEVKNTESLPI